MIPNQNQICIIIPLYEPDFSHPLYHFILFLVLMEWKQDMFLRVSLIQCISLSCLSDSILYLISQQLVFEMYEMKSGKRKRNSVIVLMMMTVLPSKKSKTCLKWRRRKLSFSLPFVLWWARSWRKIWVNEMESESVVSFHLLFLFPSSLLVFSDSSFDFPLDLYGMFSWIEIESEILKC